MGMSFDEYWNGPSELVVYYRRAQEIKASEHNQQMWIQGQYFLAAMATMFDKKAKYPDEPFKLRHEVKKEEARKNTPEYIEAERQKAIAFFNAFAQQNKKRGGG